ncbi:AraC family transcriptional regulator [Sphingobium sp. CR2-8]|uniref:AraC family transcriptional regulator n=1 Tax=Sphingobium sp. CR2-8 TaxID=1306534 RepID=UPI002DBED2D6|nr:AraC family transcriptional regulator [Sphingobium sp. CR2-8]MEC3909205.1 AraC family transcriptional regulator [Sphingobium sp. CR2-8]
MNAVEHFSTRLIPASRRHIFWREVVADAFPGMTAHAPEGIRAELVRLSLGPIGLARALSERAQVSRVSNDSDDQHLLFHLLHRGRMTMVHGDQINNVAQGDIAVVDDHQPYTLDISHYNDCLILQVPKALMGPDIMVQDWHGRLLSAQNPNVALLSHLLQGLWTQRERFDDLDAEAGVLLADAARMVCRRGAARAMPTAPSPSPVDFALANLDHPDLGTALIGQALNLSSRTVQKSFFRHVGATPTAFITTRRLDKAAQLLSLADGRTITDIAFAVGFSDSAFFTRCFRRKFGLSPSQWRNGGSHPS